MSYRIGVLGSNGKVGTKLCDFLDRNNISFVKASRSGKKTLERHFIFDIYNAYEFESFLKSVDIVINCIGPTFYYGKFIAEKIISNNKIYIDAFGDEFVCENIQDSINSVVVISAGDCPGFSGVIPFWVKKKYYDKISKMEISYFCGGEVTASGLLDILMSTDMGYGFVSTYYKFGKYIKINNSCMTKHLNCFDRDFYCKPFINNEIVDVANSLDIDEIYFNNLYYNEKRDLLLRDIYSEISDQNISWKDANSILINKLDLINDVNFDGTVYKIEVEGKKSGRDRTLTLEITAAESYTISAYILYKTIERLLLSDCKLDVRKIRPFDLIDSEVIFREMIELGIIKNISENKNVEYDVGTL